MGGVDRNADATRRAQLPKVSDQAVGNIDGRGRATVGEPTRLVEPRRRIRESLTERAGRFAARQTLERGARCAKSSGHVDAIADSRRAASERRERGAEHGRRDRELGAVAQVAAEDVCVRARHGVGDAVGERIELGAPRVGDHHRDEDAERPSGHRGEVAERGDDGATRDLARREPTGPEVFSLDDAVDAGDERVTARHGEYGRIVADAFGTRAEPAKDRANCVELGAGTEGRVGSHRGGGPVDRSTGGPVNCDSGEFGENRIARRPSVEGPARAELADDVVE